MQARRFRVMMLIGWIGLVVICLTQTARANSAMALRSVQQQADSEGGEPVSLPEDLRAGQVDRIIAGLSDEQVRRLLINELRSRAREEGAIPDRPEGMAGVIERVKDLMVLFQTRMEHLRSGGRMESGAATGIYALLGTGGAKATGLWPVILSVAAVLAGGLLVQLLYVLYTAPARRRIVSVAPAGWRAGIGALSARAMMDLGAILVLIAAVLVFFFLFLERLRGQQILMAAYLTGLVCVQLGYVVLRFFLAPGASALRFLPIEDETAVYLHHWVLSLVFVITFGNVTIGVIRLAGATDLTALKWGMVVGLIAAGILILMIIQKRRAVAALLAGGLPETSLRCRLARRWHYFAVFAVVVLLAATMLAEILGASTGQARRTLLMIPLYLLLDWLLCGMLGAAFGVVEGGHPGTAPSDVGKGLDLDRVKRPLRGALRISLAVLMGFWILKIWNIAIPIGETVVRTIIEILLVVLICYIGYCFANAAIMRRLEKELPGGADEDAEEGGAGGSRIGTLLMLLRKFLMVVIIVMAALIILSSIGVNIGPLIAGAGVFGLAIGFGAQTLVKDIISGVFFLVDDAIRVGDYVECGTAKGTVEQISLRSLRLRHPRGPVHILPFGDINNVTNLSRDYVIMKLDFRVRYDADVEKIRKIIKKKVYQPIMDDPELGPKLLDKIKSQGVRQLDDSAMVMRVKYKTRPGDQFIVRKEVYRLMQEAFKAEGIEFAHRNVTVYIPPEVQQTVAQADAEARGRILSGAAGALAAVEEAEEEKLKEKTGEG